MTDDPIKAALAEAEAVLSEWLLDATGRPRVVLPQEQQKMTAAAVAAFLRALEARGSVRLPDDYGLLLPYIPKALAAAVERAAQEARDGE